MDRNIETLRAFTDNRQIWLAPRLLQWLVMFSPLMAQFLHHIPTGLVPSSMLAIFLILFHRLNAIFKSNHPLI